jgi:hypothetical protein
MAGNPDAPPALCAPCLTACAMRSWYPAHRRHTFRTELIALEPPFLAYLDADGVVLPTPADPANLSPLDPRAGRAAAADEGGGGGGDDAALQNPPPCFPSLECAIVAAITALGGDAFPKLDWTAPADATWVAPAGSLRCATAGDVFLLLKSSDLARYDLDLARRLQGERGGSGSGGGEPQPQPPAFTPHLALRTWYPLHPAGEWRVFVRGRRVVGVSQRHTGQRFDHLAASPEERHAARDALLDFYERKVRGAFPLRDYAWDAYIDRRGRVWLLDFAPFGYETSPLLFGWDELLAGGGQAAPEAGSLACCEHAGGSGANSEAPAPAPPATSADAQLPEVRVVMDGAGGGGGSAFGFAPLAQHRYPNDLLNLAAATMQARAAGGGDNDTAGGGGGGDVAALIEQLAAAGSLFRRGNAPSSDDDDDSDGRGGNSSDSDQ